MISSFNPTPVNAGNISTQPDPELLQRFEAERDAADADLKRAAELRKSGEEKIRRAEEMQRQLEAESNAELCRLGVLPASQCP